MASRPDLRIGDADRESAASVLREHYAEGRLTLDEFNQRLDDTFAATTQRQLAKITQDLPHLATPAATPPPVPHQPPARPRHSHVLPVVGLLAALLVVGSVVYGGGPGFFPGRIIAVVIIIAIVRGLVFRGRHHHGGGPGGPYRRYDRGYDQIHERRHHHHHRHDRYDHYDGPRFSGPRFGGPGGFGGPRLGGPGGFGGPRLSRDAWGE